jgi:hypothetical protein
MKVYKIILAFFAVSFLLNLAGCDFLKQPVSSQEEKKYKGKVSDLILTYGNTETRSSSALPGALVGAGAAITGGMSIPLTTAVGGAVGYAAHGESTNSPSVTECRFRVNVLQAEPNNLNLSYYGDIESGGADFKKCVNLKNGDDLEIVNTNYYEDGKFMYHHYKWKVGVTTGLLN